MHGEPAIGAAAYARAHTAPDEAIFADHVATFSVLANRPPGARVAMLISLVNHDAAPQRIADTLRADLRARRPALILLPVPAAVASRLRAWEAQPVLASNPARRAGVRAAWARFIGHVERHYELEHETGGITIFRRRREAEGAGSS